MRKIKVPSNVTMKLRQRKVVSVETTSCTVQPFEVAEKIDNVYLKVGIEKVELINLKFTDNIPIFRVNEANIKAKCHRALYQWSQAPSPLNKPPRETYGKGMTLDQSKLSAVMEAVERYCAQPFPHSNIVYGSYDEVQDYAIHPSKFKFPSVIPPKCIYCMARELYCFHNLKDVCYEWSWGFSLIKRKPVLIPAALVYYPYMSSNGRSFMFNDTGGLASGLTLEEAILHGIAEVIERDALYNAFSLGNMYNMSVLEYKDTSNEYIIEFINKAIPPGRIFTFLLKNEVMLNIPTVAAFVCYKKSKEGFIFGGSGTHLNPEVALLRALTETEQQKVRKKMFMEFDKSDLLPSDKTPIEDVISVKRVPNRFTGNVKKDIEIYLNELSRNGMDAIAVNLTHPDIGIPVVRVIVPEMVTYSMPIKQDFLITITGTREELKALK